MNEAQRWDVQACLWRNVARVCSQSDSVFCYDLMNEPVLPGKKKETQWLLGDFAGKHFVQRISLDLAGRSRQQVAKAWVDRLVSEIRQEDKHHMVTVGVIPWAMVFTKAKPFFYSKQVSEKLDFVSVHFYPKKGQVNEAVKALSVYDIGKPLLIEEMFPLEASSGEMKNFIRRSVNHADGWVSFYWGKTIEEYKQDDGDLKDTIIGGWLTDFKNMKSEIHEMVRKIAP